MMYSTLLFVVACGLLSANAFNLILSEQEAVTHLIKDILAPNLEEHAVNIFQRIFWAHPNYQILFSEFSDVPINNLAKNPAMRDHAKDVVMKFSACVLDNIGNEMSMIACFKDFARFYKAKNVGPSQAKDLMKVVKEYLRETLKDEYSYYMETGITHVFDLVGQAFQEAK